MIEPQDIVNALNEFHANDPAALHVFRCMRVPHNGSFIEHPSIIVGPSIVDPEQMTIGMLGFLQALVYKDGFVIAEQWEDEVDEFDRHKFLGYCLVPLDQVTRGSI